MTPRFALAALLALSAPGFPAFAQDDGGGIGPAPAEARGILIKSVKAMGGREALVRIRSAVMAINPKEGPIKERHVLRLDGRAMHYASRRKSGAGFDVVVGGGQAFLCDRSKEGKATYVEDLNGDDACEGAYERDVLFMPFLLVHLVEDKAKLSYVGRNSKGHHVIKALVTPPRGNRHEKPFVIRLRFHKDTHLLIAAMGVVPLGQDKGKKRYCESLDYKPQRFGPATLTLPSKLRDKRGKELPARDFDVRWLLNSDLPTDLFVRPNVVRKD